MTKKNIFALTVTFLLVAGFYFYLYKDAFRKADIQIFHTIRPKTLFGRRRAKPGQEDVMVITFGLGREYKLTSVKVIPVNELETNKYALPIWQLVSDSNSIPTRAFSYGDHIRGMHSAVKGAVPDPLSANIPYRLLLEAGSMKGVHDFTLTEDVAH